jgi:hypothetical protein
VAGPEDVASLDRLACLGESAPLVSASAKDHGFRGPEARALLNVCALPEVTEQRQHPFPLLEVPSGHVDGRQDQQQLRGGESGS